MGINLDTLDNDGMYDDCPTCGYDSRFHTSHEAQYDTCPTPAELEPCLCGEPAHPDADLERGCGQYRPIGDYGRTEPAPPLDLNVRVVHMVMPVTREFLTDRMIPIPGDDE